MTRAGLTSVARLGRRLGLPVDDLRVLSSRGNLLVHLAPAPVLARAVTLTAATRADPAAWVAREIGVSAWAASRGGPVAQPTTLVDPGPHDADGLVVGLMEFRAGTPGRAEGRELGEALAALHAATADYPGELPWLAPAHEQVGDALRTAAAWLPAATTGALRAHHQRVLADLDGAGSAPVVLHGDAHAGNLLRSGNGWFWVDLEETSLGPPEWDLAVLDDPVAIEAYRARTGLVVADLAPFRAARELEGAVWLQVMARQFPARYRQAADERLAALLGRAQRSRRRPRRSRRS